MHECSNCGTNLEVYESYVCEGSLYEECYCKTCGHEESFRDDSYHDYCEY